MRRLLSAALLLVASCGAPTPDPILYGADTCKQCRMEITDPHFGAAIVTTHRRTLAFDSIECVVGYYKSVVASGEVSSVWVADYTHPGVLLDASKAIFVTLGPGRAPMGRGLAAVPDSAAARGLGLTAGSALERWSDLL